MNLRSICTASLRTIRRIRLRAISCAAIALGGGCVERKLTLTSEPSGALVFMNDKEIGRTPIETDFVWYGKYDVQVRKDGFLTYNHPQRLKSPWWQVPPIDLFAELMPWHPTDRQALHFRLDPRPTTEPDLNAMIARAAELRPLLESTRYPATAPATQPAPAAATPVATPAMSQPAAGQIVTQPTVQPSSK